ncbi:MAG: AMP-binding protein, partial [Flavobacteriales bacterium]|nr:AMP-binding protein [Flavobacteriales bacterium]
MTNDPHRLRTIEDHHAASRKAINDPDTFWAAEAEGFTWHRMWDKVLEWDFERPRVAWYIGGKLNITENCLDRHLQGRGNKVALIWEPNDPDAATQRFTYRELHKAVCRYANVLKRNGVKKGDR